MIELLIVVAIAAAFVISSRAYGAISIPSAGVFGATLYSVPTIINSQAPFSSSSGALRLLEETTQSSDLLVLLSWAAFVSALILLQTGKNTRLGWLSRGNSSAFQEPNPQFHILCVLLSLGGIAYLVSTQGLLFIAEARGDQTNDLVTLFWRWAVLLGFVSSLLRRDRAALFAQAAFLLILFLRGDRTMLAIAVVAAVLSQNSLSSGVKIIKLKSILAAGFASILLIFGKPIYLNVKAMLSGNSHAVAPVDLQRTLYEFEPLTTTFHIQHVLDYGFYLTMEESIGGIFGNLLLFPSMFGVSTNVYNELVTSSLPDEVKFGVAGNLTAYAYAAAGWIGIVAIYAALAAALHLLEKCRRQYQGWPKVVVIVLGATVAIYVHRNALDNFLSFVRQIVLLGLILGGASRVLATKSVPTR